MARVTISFEWPTLTGPPPTPIPQEGKLSRAEVLNFTVHEPHLTGGPLLMRIPEPMPWERQMRSGAQKSAVFTGFPHESVAGQLERPPCSREYVQDFPFASSEAEPLLSPWTSRWPDQHEAESRESMNLILQAPLISKKLQSSFWLILECCDQVKQLWKQI